MFDSHTYSNGDLGMKNICRVIVVICALLVCLCSSACNPPDGRNSPFNIKNTGYWICADNIYLWFKSEEGTHLAKGEGYFCGKFVDIIAIGKQNLWEEIDISFSRGDYQLFTMDTKCYKKKIVGTSARAQNIYGLGKESTFVKVDEKQFQEWKKQWTLEENEEQFQEWKDQQMMNQKNTCEYGESGQNCIKENNGFWLCREKSMWFKCSAEKSYAQGEIIRDGKLQEIYIKTGSLTLYGDNFFDVKNKDEEDYVNEQKIKISELKCLILTCDIDEAYAYNEEIRELRMAYNQHNGAIFSILLDFEGEKCTATAVGKTVFLEAKEKIIFEKVSEEELEEWREGTDYEKGD